MKIDGSNNDSESALNAFCPNVSTNYIIYSANRLAEGYANADQISQLQERLQSLKTKESSNNHRVGLGQLHSDLKRGLKITSKNKECPVSQELEALGKNILEREEGDIEDIKQSAVDHPDTLPGTLHKFHDQTPIYSAIRLILFALGDGYAFGGSHRDKVKKISSCYVENGKVNIAIEMSNITITNYLTGATKKLPGKIRAVYCLDEKKGYCLQEFSCSNFLLAGLCYAEKRGQASSMLNDENIKLASVSENRASKIRKLLEKDDTDSNKQLIFGDPKDLLISSALTNAGYQLPSDDKDQAIVKSRFYHKGGESYFAAKMSNISLLGPDSKLIKLPGTIQVTYKLDDTKGYRLHEVSCSNFLLRSLCFAETESAVVSLLDEQNIKMAQAEEVHNDAILALGSHVRSQPGTVYQADLECKRHLLIHEKKGFFTAKTFTSEETQSFIKSSLVIINSLPRTNFVEALNRVKDGIRKSLHFIGKQLNCVTSEYASSSRHFKFRESLKQVGQSIPEEFHPAVTLGG